MRRGYRDVGRLAVDFVCVEGFGPGELPVHLVDGCLDLDDVFVGGLEPGHEAALMPDLLVGEDRLEDVLGGRVLGGLVGGGVDVVEPWVSGAYSLRAGGGSARRS